MPLPVSVLTAHDISEALTLCEHLLAPVQRAHLILFQVPEGDGTLVPILHARHPGSGERSLLLRPHTS